MLNRGVGGWKAITCHVVNVLWCFYFNYFQVFRNSYGKAADWWSYGVLLYLMATGRVGILCIFFHAVVKEVKLYINIHKYV